MTRFQLLVGASAEKGAPLSEAPLIVGRSRSADVVVKDPRVSRRHLELKVAGKHVLVRALEDSPAFVYEGRGRRSAELAVGERVVIGDTVLVIAGPVAGAPTHTASRTRRGGVADEARALSAISDLVEELDASGDAAAAELAARRWAAANLGTSSCRLERAGIATERETAFPIGRDDLELVVAFREAPSAMATGLGKVAARQLGSRLADLAQVERFTEENRALRTAAIGSAQEFLGSSRSAEQVATRIAKIARADSTALVLGESGTGKTFAARLIHEGGARAKEPLRILNCAAIPQSLFEAELFGAERGAFSGAVHARAGAFEAVGKGTLVLDEIGELDMSSQAKLLHALEEKRFERLGSNRSLRFEGRLIAATNRDLATMVEEGTFRRDLYFRISVVTLTIPPLRDRGDDVKLLAERLLVDLAPTAGRRVEGFGKRAIERIQAYDWPGNVRELRNVIEHALVMGESPLIEPDDLPERLLVDRKAAAPRGAEGGDAVRLPARLDWLEGQAIEAALRATGGNRTKAATILGINRVTLQNKLGPSKRSGD